MKIKTEPFDEILNPSALIQLVSDIGPSTVEIVIVKAIADLKSLFCDVFSSVQIADWNALRMAVHSISGVSALVGGQRLRQISLQVEQNCLDDNIADVSLNVAGVMRETKVLIERLGHFGLKEVEVLQSCGE
jgi:HPt (histidine-containing phosphotransfer) domain-containing protein